MSICVLTYSSYGAFATVARNLAKGVREAGVEVDVLYLKGQEPADVAGFPDNARLIRLRGRSRTCWVAVARHLRRNRPEALISLGWVLNPAAVFAVGFARTGTPLILNEASSLSYKTRVEHRHDLNLRILGPLARVLYPRAAAVTGVSSQVLDDLENVIGIDRRRVPFAVVPNAVDGDEVVNRAQDPDPGLVVAGSAPMFVSVARHVRQKNLPLLLRAFHRYRASGGTGKLVLVGQGPETARLRALARDLRLGLGTDVTFRGGLANPFPQMAAASAFVLSSEEEGFGLVIVEAMALGVPVIATACPGGPSEILGEGHAGLLVPNGDEQALADAMHRLATDDALRTDLAAAASRRARDFTPTVIGRRWLQIIATATEFENRRRHPPAGHRSTSPVHTPPG